jgi:hypothetical protein
VREQTEKSSKEREQEARHITVSHITEIMSSTTREQPKHISEYDHRQSSAWMYSFAATMVPFTALCYGHTRGMTVKVVDGILKSRVGGYGLLALPFCTLAMEKSVYDTVQAWQGIDPNVRPADRGGFPSGGAALPSFSLIAVQRPSTKDLM